METFFRTHLRKEVRFSLNLTAKSQRSSMKKINCITLGERISAELEEFNDAMARSTLSLRNPGKWNVNGKSNLARKSSTIVASFKKVIQRASTS